MMKEGSDEVVSLTMQAHTMTEGWQTCVKFEYIVNNILNMSRL